MASTSMQVSPCKQLPSSFTAHVAGAGPVLVLANGTPHLYCIDAATKGLLASVRYSCDVRYVTSLMAGNVTCALSCLDKGHVITTSLESVFSKPASQDRDDIFKDLLFNSSSQEPGCVIGDRISVTIAIETDSTVSLLQAHVVRNTLIVCGRSRVNGDHTLSVYDSSRRTRCGGCEVPLFTGPPQAVYSLSAAVPREPVRDTLAYRPAVYCVRCEGTGVGGCDVSLHSDLFSKLFGAEVTLSGSPVTLLGCQNGHVYYSSQGGVRVEGNPPYEPHPFPIMYSLGQPVQSIHAVYLPEHETDSLSAPLSQSTPPNSLILIGRLGKLVVCTAGGCSQRAPSYCEFHVPGPIISSVLVDGSALYFTTLSGVYRVCLEESCVRRRGGHKASHTVIISEKNFQVLSKMAALSEGAVLLGRLRVSGARGEMVDELTSLSLGGSLMTSRATSCVCEGGVSMERDESKLVDQLTDCLRSLEATSSKLAELRTKRDAQDEALTELGGVLDLLCHVARGRKQERLFVVCHVPGFENVGVKLHKPYVDICATYSGATPLAKGWSFLIQLVHSSTMQESTSNSQLVPLAGLQPGGELTTRVGLENFDCLHHTIHCYVHYTASHLVGGVTTPTSGTLPLSKKSFDLMDFLLPSVPLPRQLPWQPLRSVNEEDEQFGHSKDIDISMETVTKVIAVHKEVTCTQERDICRVFLSALLSRRELAELISEPEPELSEVTVGCYNGRQLCLQACVESGRVVLSLYTSSERALCEAVECVSRRLHL